jgi:hypothetical protein
LTLPFGGACPAKPPATVAAKNARRTAHAVFILLFSVIETSFRLFSMRAACRFWLLV